MTEHANTSAEHNFRLGFFAAVAVIVTICIVTYAYADYQVYRTQQNDAGTTRDPFVARVLDDGSLKPVFAEVAALKDVNNFILPGETVKQTWGLPVDGIRCSLLMSNPGAYDDAELHFLFAVQNCGAQTRFLSGIEKYPEISLRHPFAYLEITPVNSEGKSTGEVRRYVRSVYQFVSEDCGSQLFEYPFAPSDVLYMETALTPLADDDLRWTRQLMGREETDPLYIGSLTAGVYSMRLVFTATGSAPVYSNAIIVSILKRVQKEESHD